MKKIIFLLFPLLTLAQNPTNFPYGIKNPAATSDSAPAYFTTTQVDGVHKKTPAALVAKVAIVNDSLATKENVANKSANLNTVNNTLYPTTLAVQNQYFDTTKKWVLFGDSFSDDLTGSDFPFSVIQDLKLTGTVTNAVGGHRSYQQLAVLKSLLASNPSYLNSFNILSLLVGVNDFVIGIPLGNRNSLKTDLNYAGYIKDFIETALSANPNIEMYIMTPPEGNNASVPYNGVNLEGWTLKELSVLISQICSDYSIKCIDLYSTAQFNLNTIPTYTSDGLHPWGTGIEKIKDIVKNRFIDKQTSFKPVDLSSLYNLEGYVPYFKGGSLKRTPLIYSEINYSITHESLTPSYTFKRPTAGNDFNGIKWVTGGNLIGETTINPSTFQLKISSLGSEGHISFFTYLSEKARIDKYGNMVFGDITPLVGLDVRNGTDAAISTSSTINGTLNVGSASTTGILNFGVNGSTYHWIQARNAFSASWYPLALNPNGGKVMIGGSSNDGVNALQVYGSAKISSLAGTGDRNVVAGSDGTLKIGDSRPYNVYTALISQSGTSAPTATVLENTLGGTIVWTRNSTGQYFGTLSTAFVSDKTFCLTGGNTNNENIHSTTQRNNDNEIVVQSYSSGAKTDGVLNKTAIEIRVYN